jgi:hypothetical protein
LDTIILRDKNHWAPHGDEVALQEIWRYMMFVFRHRLIKNCHRTSSMMI